MSKKVPLKSNFTKVLDSFKSDAPGQMNKKFHEPKNKPENTSSLLSKFK